MKLLNSILLVSVFLISLFLSSALMFTIEPMVAKMLLPLMGGAGNVWNTCVFFFQCLLLLGYLYAHFLNSVKISPMFKAVIHLIVIWLPILALPVKISEQDTMSEHPYLYLLLLLTATVGGIFFALSTSAPLLQKWYVSTRGPRAKDPYFLYAASNLGSLVGLLSYPFVIEPEIGLAAQSNLLSKYYVAFASLISLCTIFYVLKASSKNGTETQAEEQTEEIVRPSWKSYGQWIFLTLLPSSLVLGVTSFVTCELSAFPLFWLIPLSIYILSFVIVFSHYSPKYQKWLDLLALAFSLYILANFWGNYGRSWSPNIGVSYSLITLFLVCMACHGRVAGDRPASKYLTHYFLCIALGGIIGSSINTFIAPILLSNISEYPTVLAICAAVFFSNLSLFKFKVPAKAVPWIVTSAALGVQFFYFYYSDDRTVLAKRNFFGLLRIKVDEKSNLCEIWDGSIIHGGQSLDPQERALPFYYYSQDGPVWTLLKALTHTIGLKKHGVIGMGAGTMAAYAAPGQSIVFFELNPAVVEVSTNPFYFTFIYDAVKRDVDVDIQVGDGRLNMAQEKDKDFSMIVIDAYSSDSIPTHLMTKEAIALYNKKLVDGGAMAFHITNGYFETRDVLAKGAESLGLKAVSLTDDSNSGKKFDEAEQATSDWVVISRDEKLIQNLKDNFHWKDIPISKNTKLWTDDYCDLLSALKDPFS